MASDDRAANTLRVTLAWPYRSWGGAQTYLGGFCRHLPPAALVTAVVPRDSDPVLTDYLSERGIAVVEGGDALDVTPAASVLHRVRRRWADTKALDAMRAAIVATDPDVVHVDLTPWVSTIALLRLARRTPVFCTLHTPLDGHRLRRSWRWRARFLAGRPSVHFIGANERAAGFYGRWLGDGTALAVIESGVDRVELDDVPRKPVDGLVVGAGQLIERKGVDVLLHAFSIVRATVPHLTVRWFGDGPMRDELTRRIAEDGASVHFQLSPPSAVRADHLRAVAQASVYVQPSREDGLPQAMLEAMALGVPVAVTDVGSVSTVVRDGVNGRVVAPGDASAFAAALIALLAGPAAAARLGLAGQQSVHLRFDASTAAAAHLSRYRSEVAAHPRRRRA